MAEAGYLDFTTRAALQSLRASSDRLARSYERLSSGLRINRASDDPAGLALHAALATESAIMGQAFRNINDGISLINTAEEALRELDQILARQQELATQATNESMNAEQRSALNEEAQALLEEYNRILATVEYNSISLFSASPASIAIQAGPDSSVPIQLMLQRELEAGRLVPDGTFSAGTSCAAASPDALAAADVNGDQLMDIVAGSPGSDYVAILLGNGDGTFQIRRTYAAGDNPRQVHAVDIDGDTVIDILTPDQNSSTFSVLIGNGNGTFKARISFAPDSGSNALALNDLDGDGRLDAVLNNGSGTISVLLGNGNGTFQPRTTWQTLTNGTSISLADLNGDGRLDAFTNRDSGRVAVLLGNGNGTFAGVISYNSGVSAQEVEAADIDGNGQLDIVVAGWGGSQGAAAVLLGNGNGTFRAPITSGTFAGSRRLLLADFDQDGYHDIALRSTSGSNMALLFGNGDGTFTAQVTYLAEGVGLDVAYADFTGDGLGDLITRRSGFVGLYAVNSVPIGLSLASSSQAEAALDYIEAARTELDAELASVRAAAARLEHALRYAAAVRENLVAAADRIIEVDAAMEIAEMLRQQIIQQGAVAMAAQANLLRERTLVLLEAL